MNKQTKVTLAEIRKDATATAKLRDLFQQGSTLDDFEVYALKGFLSSDEELTKIINATLLAQAISNIDFEVLAEKLKKDLGSI